MFGKALLDTVKLSAGYRWPRFLCRLDFPHPHLIEDVVLSDHPANGDHADRR